MIPGPGKTTSVAPLPQSLIKWRKACKVSFWVKVKVKRGTQYQDEIVHNCKHRWRKACKVKFIQGKGQDRESSEHNIKTKLPQSRIRWRNAWQMYLLVQASERIIRTQL